jgi:hypothetical protein
MKTKKYIKSNNLLKGVSEVPLGWKWLLLPAQTRARQALRTGRFSEY